ncbi:MAG: hypothetical protein ABRQ38_22280 [Candidatus Eremiobacterota bacterium]
MYTIYFHGMNFKRHKAMSLAEVIMATAILGVVIVTIIGTLTTGLEALQKSINYTQANIIAQRIIENYKSKDYSQIVSDSNSIEGFNYNVNVTSGYLPSDPNQCYKKVTVLVESKDYDKASIKKRASVKMETIFVSVK